MLVLLNYNDYETCKKYLNNVVSYKNIDHIVVVDNASTDNSYNELLKFSSNKVDVIQTEKNLGYAYGNNFGMKYAMNKYKCKYFIISNPDVSFEDNIIESMINILEKNKDVALVAPRMKSNNSNNIINPWKQPNYFANICKMVIVLDKIFGKRFYYKSDYFKESTSTVDVIPGSFFCVKADIMKEVKYFDENTFLYCEENILAMKLKKNKYKEVVLNNCYFNHEHSTSIDKSYKGRVDKYKILYESLYYYNKEYLNIGILKKILFKFIFVISKVEKIIIGIIK